MSRFSEVRTEYVRSKIVGAPYHDQAVRSYIAGLITLEQFIVKGPVSFAEAMCLHGLRTNYPLDYAGILRELDPEGHKQDQKARQQDAASREESDRQRLIQQQHVAEIEKAQWLHLGGRP